MHYTDILHTDTTFDFNNNQVTVRNRSNLSAHSQLRSAFDYLAGVDALKGGGLQERACFQNNKKVDFLSTAFAPMPQAPDLQKTSCARMTRRPPVAECRVLTTCLCTNVQTGLTVSPRPDTTECKTLQVVTTANTSTNVSQPERCDKQTQPQATAAEQPRAYQSGHH